MTYSPVFSASVAGNYFHSILTAAITGRHWHAGDAVKVSTCWMLLHEVVAAVMAKDAVSWEESLPKGCNFFCFWTFWVWSFNLTRRSHKTEENWSLQVVHWVPYVCHDSLQILQTGSDNKGILILLSSYMQAFIFLTFQFLSFFVFPGLGDKNLSSGMELKDNWFQLW